MILLSNQAAQTIAPGQAVVFDQQIYKVGRCECHRTGSSVMTLCTANPYEVSFSGNVTNSVAGPATKKQMRADVAKLLSEMPS